MEQVKKIFDWLTAGDIEDREVRLAERRAKAAAKRVVIKENRGINQAMASPTEPFANRPHSKSEVSIG